MTLGRSFGHLPHHGNHGLPNQWRPAALRWRSAWPPQTLKPRAYMTGATMISAWAKSRGLGLTIDPGGHEVSMALSDPPANKAPDDKNTSHKHYFNHVRPWIKGALVVGWIGILICAASSQDPSGGWLSFLRRLGFGTLIGGGAAVGGFVVGFLFGIPKTPDHATSSVNTNLEQVSDWLTKIIVGISLVEVNRIIGKVSQLATFLGNGMSWSSGGPEYATAVIIYYLPLGFFFGWVITRTFISKWLASRGGEK